VTIVAVRNRRHKSPLDRTT